MYEEWRDIPGYPGYRVSTQGRVVSYRRYELGQVLNPYTNPHGYAQVGLYPTKGKVKITRVHTEVMRAFIGPRPDGYQVDHINFNRLDNRLSNLEYVTPKENTRRAVVAGRKVGSPGVLHHQAKLTDAKVRVIHTGARQGTLQRELAVSNGVTEANISLILAGKRWRRIWEEFNTP